MTLKQIREGHYYHKEVDRKIGKGLDLIRMGLVNIDQGLIKDGIRGRVPIRIQSKATLGQT